MRLFKLACLAYKPSLVNYRGAILDRRILIRMRRGLVDKLTNLLQSCTLFKENAHFPRRYFDDLMVEESITLNPPNISVGTQSARGQSTTP